MYIKRLKLVNFIGIKNGLNKDEIEITFPKSDKAITMINGKNGSGKSTIMSQLTPFKESFDDRKSLIIPGREGMKEIDISYNGHEYEIKHIYGKTSSSFIKEDGVELNTSGRVTTCEEIIKNKLQANKEYFKICKIGSNTTNFIQFTPADRKKYITIFIDAVKKYQDAFVIINDKANKLKNKIKQISDDLKKLDNLDTLKNKIDKNESDLKEVNLIISQTNEIIGRLNAEIDNLNSSISGIDVKTEKTNLQNLNNTFAKNIKICDFVKNNYKDEEVTLDKCKEMIDKLTQSTNDIDKEINLLNNKITFELEKKVTNENNIAKITAQVGVKEEINIDQQLAIIKDLQEKQKKHLSVINSDKDFYNIINSDSNSNNLLHLENFSKFMLTILSFYSLLNEKSIDPAKRNAECFFRNDFKSIFNSYSATITKAYKENINLLQEKRDEYSKKYANVNKLDILDMRPAECKIDKCPFIADALKYRNLNEELKNLDELIISIEKSVEDNEKQYEFLGDIKIAYSNIERAYINLNPRENNIYQYFINQYGNVEDFTKIPLNELTKDKDDLIDKTEKMISAINDYNILKSDIKIYSDKISALEKAKTTQDYFKQELVDAKAAINSSNKLITTYRNDINNLKTKSDNQLSIIKLLKAYHDALTENDKISKNIDEINKTLKLYSDFITDIYNKQNDLKKYTSLLDLKNKDLENISNAITSMKATEITINNYTKNLEEINKSYDKITTIKDALDPKSGIPLIFIKAYLDSTEYIANDLLNVAYNGKFEIKFLPTASDFFIQVRSGENVIDDIKYASQGEIAMTTISISLALIERSLGEYNIVYLDEIDGPLDKDNRESFINIINKQIKKLGLEQLFVISHNNAFDYCPMNLILLNGNQIDKTNEDFMKNKNIIYDVDE